VLVAPGSEASLEPKDDMDRRSIEACGAENWALGLGAVGTTGSTRGIWVGDCEASLSEPKDDDFECRTAAAPGFPEEPSSAPLRDLEALLLELAAEPELPGGEE